MATTLSIIVKSKARDVFFSISTPPDVISDDTRTNDDPTLVAVAVAVAVAFRFFFEESVVRTRLVVSEGS